MEKFGGSKKRGLIGNLGLSDWYYSLTKEEQEAIIKYRSRGLVSISLEFGGTSPERDSLLYEDISWTTQTPSGFLWVTGSNAIRERDYPLAEKILLKALDVEGKHTDRHFTYNELIDLYYKQRDTIPRALNKCIRYCEEDIEWFRKHKQDLIKELGRMPLIPSFSRLAIIYEKQGKFKKAAGICKKAIGNGLNDGTKGGFEARLERLKKKIDVSKRKSRSY